MAKKNKNKNSSHVNKYLKEIGRLKGDPKGSKSGNPNGQRLPEYRITKDTY